MCEDCWEQAGSPEIIFDGFYEVLWAIEKVYRENPLGGNLHCQIDDYNLGDEHFDGQGEKALETPSEKWCFFLLKSLSESERYSVVAFYDDYWGNDEPDI